MLVRLGSRALVNVIAVSDQDTSMSEILVTLTMEPANGWFENNMVRNATNKITILVAYLDRRYSVIVNLANLTNFKIFLNNWLFFFKL